MAVAVGEGWTWIGVVLTALAAGGCGWGVWRLRQMSRERHRRAGIVRWLMEQVEALRGRAAQRIRNGPAHHLVLINNTARAVQSRQACGTVLHGELKRIEGWASQALEELRALSQELHPSELSRLGFRQAIEALLSSVTPRLGFQPFRDLDNLDQVLSAASQISVYRLVEAGLENIVQHARATMVLLEIKRDGNRILIQLEDNGVGFDQATLQNVGSTAMGLIAMEERVRLIGGQFTLASVPKSGTRIRVVIPLERCG